MSSAKRQRKKALRRARIEAEQPIPEITDADLEALLSEVKVTVRADCEHASTRTTPDGVVLIKCAVGASVSGGCPADCKRFEKRRVGGMGMGLGAS